MPRLGKRKRELLRKNPITKLKFEQVSSEAGSNYDHAEFLRVAASKLSEILKEMQSTVAEIQSLVSAVNPIDLMAWCFHENMFGLSDKDAESKMGYDQVINQRVVEYVHSVIVSSPQKGIAKETLPEDVKDFEHIRSKIAELYNLEMTRKISEGAKFILETGSIPNSAVSKLKSVASGDWQYVRGDRYMTHDKEFYNHLILPHNTVIERLFGVTAKELLEGIIKLEEFHVDEYNRMYKNRFDLGKKLDQYGGTSVISGEVDFEKYVDANGLRSEFEELFQSVASLDPRDRRFFDAGEISGLPLEVLEKFSFSIGEYDGFYDQSTNSGTPSKQLPCQIRPFIKVENRVLYFDEYTLRDDFYRGLQRCILELEPSYKEHWDKKQQAASEGIVRHLFQRLLPDANIFSSAYYTDLKGQRCEADLIIEFDGTLLVVEVKANQFLPKSPDVRFKSYVQQLEKVVQKPVDQAYRFLNVLEQQREVTLTDESGVIIKTIRRQDFSIVAPVIVPIEHSSLFAQAEFMSGIGIDVSRFPTWVVSVSDLLVYADLFWSPLRFIHYISVRLRSIVSKDVKLDDELDHLGLYFTHNDVSILAADFHGVTEMKWVGYRDSIDKYFQSRRVGVESPIPQQNLPPNVIKILSTLEKQKKIGRTIVACWLLDGDGELRNTVDKALSESIRKYQIDRRVRPVFIPGALPTVVFFTIGYRETEFETYNDQRKYAIGTFKSVSARCPELLLLSINGANDDEFVDISFEFISPQTLAEYSENEISKLAESFAKSRIETAFRQYGVIRRNDVCPCGSGKKWKVCHGKH